MKITTEAVSRLEWHRLRDAGEDRRQNSDGSVTLFVPKATEVTKVRKVVGLNALGEAQWWPSLSEMDSSRHAPEPELRPAPPRDGTGLSARIANGPRRARAAQDARRAAVIDAYEKERLANS